MNSSIAANDQPASITSVFSGACVELTFSSRHGKPFNLPTREDQKDFVFVLVAEVAPLHFALIARGNPYAKEGQTSIPCVFFAEIDDTLLMAADMPTLTVALKPEGSEFWYQFSFEYDIEFWGLVSAFSHINTMHFHRQTMIGEQIKRLRSDFLTFFKPTVAPYNDPNEIQHMREEEEEKMKSAMRRRQRRARRSHTVDSGDDIDCELVESDCE
ncbi:hypothetical protein C8Q76DRAFT_798458 [Earliella scabrosa]|nr:hypothetical protein C8Q76DRAFT_798458 [Earliella scabrosa]